MSKPLVIVGGGRFARVIFDVIDGDRAANPVAGFLDDTMPVGTQVCGFPVLAGFSAMRDHAFVRDHAWFVALGDNIVRKDIGHALADAGGTIVNLVHPSAYISRRATLGKGIYIGPFQSLGPGAVIGDWVIVEGHGRFGVEARAEEGAFIGAGVVLTGNSSVGAGSFMGAGVVVGNKVAVGAGCVIGANSTVLRNLPDGVTAAGSPAQPKSMTRRPFSN